MQDCAHPACTCRHERSEMVERGGRHYCNESCARQEASKDGCDCGHPGCQG